MRALPFAKYEGLGNDFVVIDSRGSDDVSAEAARALCDRRRGVGADGVLLVAPSSDAAFAARMRVVNADGSVPEMCGNGLRCVALHVARARGIERADLTFETDAGPRRCHVDDARGEGMVTVDMGIVSITGARAVDLGDERPRVLVADAGNPHAILFGEFTRADVDRIGPRVATHADFPRGTNVEFARISGANVDLVVWERGVGVTLACGTGACATVAAACHEKLLPRGVAANVRLPGGALEITIDDAMRATMRGPARHVFSGTLAPR